LQRVDGPSPARQSPFLERVAQAPPGGIAGTGITSLLDLSFVQTRMRAGDTEGGPPPPPPMAVEAYKKQDRTNMTATLERYESLNIWERFCSWITSLENRLYIGWFGVVMIPTLLTATTCFIIAFIAAPPVDIDGIREPVAGSLMYGNNIITGAVIPRQTVQWFLKRLVFRLMVSPLTCWARPNVWKLLKTKQQLLMGLARKKKSKRAVIKFVHRLMSQHQTMTVKNCKNV
jgi:hypothetical protein